ncbi:beta-1,3-galactosyltransferase 5-like [Saccostrea echinata]|uniref:beta-1,3-galactosyltransferase 5-like n=1 Tax=Saccostrea echinata TaxID=191078 RepID=UPI002A826B11|nr:beta-1,3-galactosyltransferase 5-like [Saccostrea echinata]
MFKRHRKFGLFLVTTNTFIFFTLLLYSAFYSRRPNLIETLSNSVINARDMTGIKFFSSYLEKRQVIPDKCEEEVELLILIPSSAWNFEQRDAVRTTWGNINSTDAKMKLVFLTGRTLNDTIKRKLDKEGRLHKDLVQENFQETYDNLTNKSVALLKWANLNCPAAKYVLKTDDDMFINIQNLVNLLRRTKPKNSILGVKNSYSVPFRDPGSKWYVSKKQYPKDKYPSYISGTAYIITGDIMSALFNTTKYLPSLFIEDVYITGICREAVGAKAVHVSGFDSGRSSGKINGANFQDRITGHHFSPNDIKLMWNELMKATPRSSKNDQ